MFSFKIQGLSELEVALSDLASSQVRRVIRASLREAAAPVEEAQKAILRSAGHTDTGHVERSIKTTISVSRKAQEDRADVSALVGVFYNKKETPVRYSKKAKKFVKRPPAPAVANWIEHGVDPHNVGFNREHPGFNTPTPFLTRSLDQKKQICISAIRERLREGIDKMARRNARRGKPKK